MSTRIQGITIELGADTSGIEKALKNINSSVGETQRELTKVNKALKLDPSNMALIEQKTRLLSSAVSQTTEKLNALKAAQAQVASGMATGQNTQSQFDALTREISNTKVKLEQLKNEQQRFANTTNSLGGALGGASGALGNFASKAQTVAAATAAISAAATAALGGIAALTVSASQQADEWNTLSQQTGLAVDSIQKFQFASGLIDVDMSDVVSALRTMKSHLDDSSDAFSRIGVNIKLQNGSLKDTETIFNEVVSAIGQIEDETQRDIAAMSIFGKKADELAGILDDGGEKMRAIGDAAEEMGYIVSPESLESLNQLNDMLEAIKAQFKGAFMQAAASAAQALAPAFQVVAAAASKLAGVIAKLDPVTMTVLVVILLLVAAISPVAGLLANVTMAAMGLSAVLPMVAAGFTQVQIAASAALGNPAVLGAVAIAAAITVLLFLIVQLIAHWDDVKEAASSAGAAIKSAFSNIQSAVVNVGNTIKSGIGSAIDGVKDAFSGIGDRIKAEFDKIPDALSKAKAGFKSFVSAVKNIGSQISNIFSNMVETAREAGERLMTGFADGVRKAISRVIETVQSLISKLKQLWDIAAGDAGRAGQRTGENFAQNYNNSSSNLRKPNFTSFSSFIPNIFNRPNTNNYNSFQSDDLLNAVNSLNGNIMRMNAAGSNVNVELVGSAKDIFSTVRVQNSQLKTATGYHALA